MNLTLKAQQVLSSSLTKENKAIQLIDLVQYIPYARIGSLDPRDMLEIGKGSCTPKHIYLAQLLQQINIHTKFLFMPFFYSKQPFPYIEAEPAVIARMPLAYHVALKIKLYGSWKTVDVTWDPSLHGFPHTLNWDGQNDMVLAVIPESIEEIEVDPTHYEKQRVQAFTLQEQQARADFYRYFDTVLEQARQERLS